MTEPSGSSSPGSGSAALINGNRRMLTSARVTEPKRGEWHTIRVVAQGPKIRAYLNDALLLNHDDKTFTGGWVGLWTKADSVTEFGNLEIAGTRTR
ncbi:MAG TPA: family 16 glycoside hydrolase [Candidatus Binatia bacterium]|nr:family 16 glycoside hydrolase [Candidatus Binatia bacterium]